MITLSDAESIHDSFPCISVTTNVLPSAPNVCVVTLKIPGFASEEEAQSDPTDYVYPFEVRIELTVPKSVLANSNNVGQMIPLRDVIVSATEGNSKVLTDDDCEVLASVFRSLIQSDNDDPIANPDFSPFTIESSSSITANGSLMTVVVQMITDATDVNLPDSLAAHQLDKRLNNNNSANGSGAGSGSNLRKGSDVSNSNNVSASNFNRNEENGDNTPARSPVMRNAAGGGGFPQVGNASENTNNVNSNVPPTPPGTVAVRVRIAKIDHMNDEKGYLTTIRDNVEALSIGGSAVTNGNGNNNGGVSGGGRGGNDIERSDPGLIMAVLIHDPISPRVLIAVMSKITNIDSLEACAGAELLRELRTCIVDVDGRGRKCRERCMSDLGSYDVLCSTQALLKQNLPFAPGNRLARVTPPTREDGVVAAKKLFVEPLLAAASAVPAGQQQPQQQHAWVKTALQIIDDKDLFKHV